jgi:ATP-dependent RNA helicase DDX5/DBP2
MAAEATDTPTKKKRTREEKEARAARKAAKKEKADRKADKSADKVETPQIAEKSAEVKGTATVFDAFSQAPFAPAVCAALEAAYPSPTPIQAQAWPLALSGEDLIAVAKTGSGKTLAFVLPILHQLQSSGKADGAVGGLVLSPTRELALQIHVEAERYAKLVGLRTACVYGGTNVREQKAALATSRPTLIVATPGRLVDLLNQDVIKLGACSHIALDEADRLLDMGFKPELEATYKALPAKRQTLLFTATWPKAVRKLASAYLRDEPTTLFLSGAQPAGDATSADASNGDGSGEGRADSGADACELSANVAVSQSFQQATDDEKDNKLWTYLCELPEGSRVIVFANTKRRVGA